jgi:shikimate dehydrogenase
VPDGVRATVRRFADEAPRLQRTVPSGRGVPLAARHGGRLAQVVNTLRFDRTAGTATTPTARASCATSSATPPPAGRRRVLMIGAGGAAAGALGPLLGAAPGRSSSPTGRSPTPRRWWAARALAAHGVALAARELDDAGALRRRRQRERAAAGDAIPVDARVLRPGRWRWT